METGIDSLKDLLEILVWLIGASSLIYAAYSYKTSQKQLNFAVIVSCTERFQKIMPQLRSADVVERQRAIKAYIDLCNEELFYFKHKYLPKEIVEEWLDGMIYYLPPIKNEKIVSSANHYLKEIDDEMLEEYPQLRKAFEIESDFECENFDYKDSQQRKNLVENIKINLKDKKSTKLIRKLKIQRLLRS